MLINVKIAINNRLLYSSSPLVPAYLSRGPPVLQHPERVVPLSDCERFEPHYQPNVALAPIAASVPIIPATSLHHRRYPHERRRHQNHRSPSPNEKSESFPVSVKLEKPSSPVPSGTTVFVPLAPSAPTAAAADETQEEHSSVNNDGICHEEKLLGHHEEEESAAVTSSTVNCESTTAIEVVTSSPEIDQNFDGSTAIELNERLVGIDLPVDIVDLIKRLSSENAILRQARITDAREITRLRDLLQIKETQTTTTTIATCKIENNEEVTNTSVVDSTESNEKPKDSTLSDSKTENEISNESNV